MLAIIGVGALIGAASVRGSSDRVLAGLLVVLDALAVVRMARSRVVVGPNGLVVRDTFRTRRIGWEEVQYRSGGWNQLSVG